MSETDITEETTLNETPSDEELEENILIHLDGFIVKNNQDNTPADETYNKAVTTDELRKFYEISVSNVISYLHLNASESIDTNLMPFVYMWSAGLLYKKYDTRPNDLIDETYPVGYGDQLIISAKTSLKPFKRYRFSAW